eukprot:GSChrysophyteH1.ASY1.ANO1.1442.1 assembled CDS
MALRKRTFIAGGYITRFLGAKHPDFISIHNSDSGRLTNPDLEWYIQESVTEALSSTRIPAESVDKMWIGNFCGELFNKQGHLGAALAGTHPGLLHKPSMRVEGACASGGLAFACALDSIQAGSSNVALVVGAEVQTTASARQGGDYLARASHYRRQRNIDDFTFPALFARRIKACQEILGYTPRDLALLSVKAFANAAKNPKAHMHFSRMDLDLASKPSEKNPAFLSNPEYKDYLKVSDCIDISSCVEVMGSAVATGNLYEDADLTSLQTTAIAGKRAFEQSRINASSGAVGVCEVHDCFTVTELLMLEALGLAPGNGGSVDLVRNGHLDIQGRLPTNTGGGLVGFGHPVGATGVKQLVEIFRQMKGKCDEYQISNIPEYGVCANMGGDDKTAVVTVLKNC